MNFIMKIFIFIFFSCSLSAAEQEYLDLVKKCLTNTIYKDPIIRDIWQRPTVEELLSWDITDLQVMTSYHGLTALENMLSDVIDSGVEGDFIETGIWRGGHCIFMRAFLKIKGNTNRTVWCADSFQGVPPPSYPQDKGLDLYQVPWLAVSLKEVQDNFNRYGLLDDQVQFLKGWFKDTLRKAPIKKLAILRLDGDLYESTMDALTALYDKVSVGGYVIIDDYGAIDVCADAVHEFRRARKITDPIIPVDWSIVYWKKTKET